ncbi:MAG TPA: hypothetical protein ENG33_07485 [Chloroflexi bacterium]|nr:hypothetical protein [Chloroflexota bacterium]
MAEILHKVFGLLAIAFLLASLSGLLDARRRIPFGVIKSLDWAGALCIGIALGDCLALYFQKRVAGEAMVPLIAGAVCTSYLLRSTHPLLIALNAAALLALSPLALVCFPSQGIYTSGGLLSLAHLVFAASGYGVLLAGSVQGLVQGSRANSRREFWFALFLMAVGVLLKAWEDKVTLGLYWTGQMEGKGGIIAVLIASAALTLGEKYKPYWVKILVLISLAGLWGLTVKGI